VGEYTGDKKEISLFTVTTYPSAHVPDVGDSGEQLTGEVGEFPAL